MTDFARERHAKWVFKGSVVRSVSRHSLPVCLGRVPGWESPADRAWQEQRRRPSCTGKAPWRDTRPARVTDPGLVGALSWRVTWPHVQILTLPAALLTSTVYSAGIVPIHKGKILRRRHFVPLSMCALYGRTGLPTV